MLVWFINVLIYFQLQTGHRVVLLQCMERIIKETLDELDSPLAVDVIKQAAMELTISKVIFMYYFKTISIHRFRNIFYIPVQGF